MGLRGWLAGAVGVAGIVATLAIPSASTVGTTSGQAPAPPPKPVVVPGCEQGCQTVFSAALPGGRRLDGLSSAGGAVLAYWSGGNLLGTTQVRGSDGRPYERVTGGVCGSGHCSVTFDFGAHSAAVASLRLDSKITVGTTVEGVVADARDLDGDGIPDAAVRQSTYDPSFALAPLYWETYLLRGDDLVPTGCSAPVHGPQDAPAAPVTGECPMNI
ncbi:hypothetical protein [Amycolatopsis acididurans]|uniref:hypothetical protein n=1 Tax=Amycolatopsis acididurans TaxID=2724524 RepID=UPI001FE90CAD|nr:hypothetical protein [Amycolatopsis acididurans]